VREKISDPAYAGWFLKFKPNGTVHVPKCDDNYSPPLCSDLCVVCQAGRLAAALAAAPRWPAAHHLA